MSIAASRYGAVVLDHFRRPRHAGRLDPSDGEGCADGARCGDRVRITVRIAEGRVSEAAFQASGCVAAIAAASIATDLVRGREVERARRLDAPELVAALGGLPEEKVQCAAVAAAAVRAALAGGTPRA